MVDLLQAAVDVLLALLGLRLGATLDAIKAGLANLKAVPGRLFPIKLAENQLLLDDSYNANVGSMTAAVQVLADLHFTLNLICNKE